MDTLTSMGDCKMNTLTETVAIESRSWEEAAPKYPKIAEEIKAIFDAGDSPHAYLCEGQDACKHPEVWKRSINATKNALRPLGLVIVATRDYRLTHRNKSPLFVIKLKTEVDKEKRENAKTAEAEAKRLEAEAEADKETTEGDVIDQVIEECNRLHLDLNLVSSGLAKYLANMAKLKAMSAKSAIEAEAEAEVSA
jgi:nucleotide-binding universal stress UspA family protein